MEEPKDKKEQCIICTKKAESDDRLVTLQTYELWQTLHEAAKIRIYTPIMELDKQLGDKEIPRIHYHLKYRSVFTMKRDLETMMKRKANEKSLSGDTGCSSKWPCRRSSESRVYDAVCIFCNKVKFQKGSRSREKLTQAVQLKADETLRKCAILKGDEKILAEAHYHCSCYKIYTKVKTKEREHECEKTDREEWYQIVEKEAYANLFDYIRTDIIPSKKIVPVTSLTMKLEFFMLSGGIELLRDSTRKHIHRTLKYELVDSVQIFPDNKGKLLMVPDSDHCIMWCWKIRVCAGSLKFGRPK